MHLLNLKVLVYFRWMIHQMDFFIFLKDFSSYCTTSVSAHTTYQGNELFDEKTPLFLEIFRKYEEEQLTLEKL